MSDPACDGHPDVAAEVRVLLLGALDRVGPVLDRLRAAPDGEPDRPCASCPLCALIATWRGERSELAARLAAHVEGLVDVLRTALDEDPGAPGSTDADTGPRSRPSGADRRPVHRISVAR